MEKGTKQTHTIVESNNVESETTNYLRALAELIFDTWKQQNSISVNSENRLVASDKTELAQ